MVVGYLTYHLALAKALTAKLKGKAKALTDKAKAKV